MTSEKFDGIVAVSHDQIVAATVTADRDFDRPRSLEYRVSVEFGSHCFQGEGADLFWAFIQAREQFEPLGWKVAVQGASRRCFPSGMQGETGAWSIYRHPEPPSETPLEGVRIFAPADPDEIGTIAEQREAHRARMTRVRQ